MNNNLYRILKQGAVPAVVVAIIAIYLALKEKERRQKRQAQL